MNPVQIPITSIWYQLYTTEVDCLAGLFFRYKNTKPWLDTKKSSKAKQYIFVNEPSIRVGDTALIVYMYTSIVLSCQDSDKT